MCSVGSATIEESGSTFVSRKSVVGMRTPNSSNYTTAFTHEDKRNGSASAWTSSVPHLHLVRPRGGPHHPDCTRRLPDQQHVETTRHSCLVRFPRAGKRGPLVPLTLSSAPATTVGGYGSWYHGNMCNTKHLQYTSKIVETLATYV